MREKLLIKFAQNHACFEDAGRNFDRAIEIHQKLLKEVNDNGWRPKSKFHHYVLIACEKCELWIMKGCLTRNHKIHKQLKSLD